MRSLLAKPLSHNLNSASVHYLLSQPMGGKSKVISTVAQLKSDNARLRSELEVFSRLFETIPQLVFIKDSQGRFVFANTAAAQFYNAEPSALLGKCDADFTASDDQVQRFVADEKKVLSMGSPLIVEKEANTDGGGKVHWLSTVKVPLKNSDGSVYVAIVATIIDRLVSLERKVNDERLRQGKRKNISRMGSIIAHKLGTRIFAIESIAHSLLEPGDGIEMFRAIDDLKQFCEDFKRLSRAERVHRQRVNLLDVLRRALLVPGISGSIDISVNGEQWATSSANDPRLDMMADERGIHDLFVELLSNSRTASAGRPLRISVDINTSSKRIGSSTRTRKEMIRIRFRDNGPGIPLRLKTHLFQPFVSSRTTGTGLGLAIVKEIVEAHGGSVEEISDVGNGACFEIIIPNKLTPPS